MTPRPSDGDLFDIVADVKVLILKIIDRYGDPIPDAEMTSVETGRTYVPRKAPPEILSIEIEAPYGDYIVSAPGFADQYVKASEWPFVDGVKESDGTLVAAFGGELMLKEASDINIGWLAAGALGLWWWFKGKK
jgi:hypothetical protein